MVCLGAIRVQESVKEPAGTTNALPLDSAVVGTLQGPFRVGGNPDNGSDERLRLAGVKAEAEVLEYRSVKSSSGQKTRRPVILTEIEILGHRWPIELTLADRDAMGFRMLLGREAVRGRFLVDAGKSYYGGKPLAKRKKKARGRRPKKSPASSARNVVRPSLEEE